MKAAESSQIHLSICEQSVHVTGWCGVQYLFDRVTHDGIQYKERDIKIVTTAGWTA
jgi:hypothetical protein